MALKNLSRRLSGNLRAYFHSRKIYPILLPIFLVPLAWTAESQYGLSSKAEKAYTTWQIQRYVESSKQIKKTDWWLHGSRSADAQETAWIDSTRKLAGQGVHPAQYKYAQLRCYGMETGAPAHFHEKGAAECGDKLSAALRNGLLDWKEGVPVDLPGMAEYVYGMLIGTVYSQPPKAGSDTLLKALLPELPALAPHNTKLAYLWADIQACDLNDTTSARLTLQEIVTNHPGTDEAKEAANHLPGLENFCRET